MDSAASSRRGETENFLLATNGSIFDRNPFKEFATNKLHDILSGKDLRDLLDMREDAVKYSEKLEKSYISRLE